MNCDLAGWAAYGYCASHSRHFWGLRLRLHLITTPSGLPVAYALTSAKADERDTCLEMIAQAQIARRGQTLIADKGHRRASLADDPQRRRHRAHPPRRPNRAATARAAVPAPAAPDHRIGQLDPQIPTQPPTPPRPHPPRRRRTHTATNTRAHHSHLAQPNHPTTRPRPIPHRLRPLTPGTNHLGQDLVPAYVQPLDVAKSWALWGAPSEHRATVASPGHFVLARVCLERSHTKTGTEPLCLPCLHFAQIVNELLERRLELPALLGRQAAVRPPKRFSLVVGRHSARCLFGTVGRYFRVSRDFRKSAVLSWRVPPGWDGISPVALSISASVTPGNASVGYSHSKGPEFADLQVTEATPCGSSSRTGAFI